MSTTLYAHPPQSTSEQQPARHTARPTALERLSLRVGLWLITYGRRSYAKAPRHLTVRDTEFDRRTRDLSWNRAQWTMRPHA